MKKPKNEGEQPQKVVSRYDQKMEKRRIQAQKDARDELIFKLACAAVAVAVIGTIIVLTAMSVVNKRKVTKDPYIKVGDHVITKLEYNYYFNMTANNYINSYSSILSYMGLDPNVDFAEQPYTETMTWKDNFDQMAVNQIIQTKATLDDAAANGFSADVAEGYQEFVSSMAAGAGNTGMSEAQYYKSFFGDYASKTNVAPFIKENLLAEAYREELMKQNAPGDEEITAEYEANKNNYDKVSYHSFTFEAKTEEGAAQEQIDAAMKQIKADAEKMVSRRKAGEAFKALCLEYAGEEQKATYEDEQTDASLTESAVLSSTPMAYQEWLSDEGRQAGDITFVEEEGSSRCYVVEFVERIYDESTRETISNTFAGEKVNEYIAALVEKYEVTDLAGEMAYLTIAETTAEAPAETGAETGAETETAAVDTAETQTPETAPQEPVGDEATAAEPAPEASSNDNESETTEQAATQAP